MLKLFNTLVRGSIAAPGVSTAARGGLSYRESHLALELLAETNRCMLNSPTRRRQGSVQGYT